MLYVRTGTHVSLAVDSNGKVEEVVLCSEGGEEHGGLRLLVSCIMAAISVSPQDNF